MIPYKAGEDQSQNIGPIFLYWANNAIIGYTSGEIQRSPRAISLLQLWDQMSASADPRVADAVTRYFAWLETPDGAAAATLRTTALATGFIGLAAADLIDTWSTFVR